MTPAALSTLKADLLDMIELNERAHVQPWARRALNALSDDARKFLRLIANTERDREQGFWRGSTIMLSIHGGVPAINDICKQAERFRALGKVKILEAAE